MEFVGVKTLKRDDSFEDFEFFDAEGDLDVDLSKFPVQEASEKLTFGMSAIICTLCRIVEEQGLVVKLPVKEVAATVVGAVAGSLIGGPSGLVLGVLTGVVMAYRNSAKHSPNPKETKSSISKIFNQMTLQQKKELVKEMLYCLKQPNVRSLIFEIIKNEKIRNTALEILSAFLLKKMGLSLVKSK